MNLLLFIAVIAWVLLTIMAWFLIISTGRRTAHGDEVFEEHTHDSLSSNPAEAGLRNQLVSRQGEY